MGKIRREAILTAAADEFSQHGFERASMSAISARAGGSKTTLYNLFKSKEDLFIEIMKRSICNMMSSAHAFLIEENDITVTLRRYGAHYLAVRQSPEMVSLVRLVYGESGRSEIGRTLYARRTDAVSNLAGFLERAMRAGKLRSGDATKAASYLLALFDADLVTEVILRIREPANAEEIIRVVDDAVSVFMAAYGA